MGFTRGFRSDSVSATSWPNLGQVTDTESKFFPLQTGGSNIYIIVLV